MLAPTTEPPFRSDAPNPKGFRLDSSHDLQSLLERSVRNLQLSSVDVCVDEDCISLTGDVATWYEKQLAQETIRLLAPERQIRNLIAVG